MQNIDKQDFESIFAHCLHKTKLFVFTNGRKLGLYYLQVKSFQKYGKNGTSTKATQKNYSPIDGKNELVAGLIH